MFRANNANFVLRQYLPHRHLDINPGNIFRLSRCGGKPKQFGKTTNNEDAACYNLYTSSQHLTKVSVGIAFKRKQMEDINRNEKSKKNKNGKNSHRNNERLREVTRQTMNNQKGARMR